MPVTNDVFLCGTPFILSLTVLLCVSGYRLHRHIGWKQLYSTGVGYSEQWEYKKAVNYLFAAAAHSPRKDIAYTALKAAFVGYGDHNTALSLRYAAQTVAEVSKLINKWYTSGNYIPFSDKEAIDEITAASEIFVSDDGSYSVYDYDAKGNLIRKSHYTDSGEILKYTVNAYDEAYNQIISAEYDAGNVTCYAENGYAADSVSFYQDGSLYGVNIYYQETDLNRYAEISYSDTGYSDAITGEVTPGNRMEAVFFSKHNRVADYHWVFFDTNTYKPQISLYGENPLWSIEDLLENS